MVPAWARRLARTALDALSPGESLAQSKDKWNSLALKNARYYVLTDSGEDIDEESFRAAGARDVERLIDQDALLHKHLDPFPLRTVLEIGCGIGRLTEFLCRRFGRVAGVDISEEMIRIAQGRLQALANFDARGTDGKNLPFPDAHFDFVFSYIVFQHMPDKETVRENFVEIGRTLKPGGIAKIQVRGVPVSKRHWYYGPDFDRSSIETLLAGLPLRTLKTEGEGTRYFWLWLERVMTADPRTDDSRLAP